MLDPGTLLSGRYRIESVLGEGGMGSVYLARVEALGNKPVAVKEMSLQLQGDEKRRTGLVRQFQQEASFLANLDHPHLVQVTDFFEDEGRHYLVMAFIRGETMMERLEKTGKALPLPHVLRWAKELCSVLGYLHRQTPPILFRDLKPSNIMLDEQDRVRLIDFGLARAFNPEGATATFLQGFGSSGYSPLEQYEGAGGTDPRSDIYALGATLFHVLTNQIPPSPIELVSTRKQMPSARQFNPAIPPGLDAVLTRMMAMSREDRYPTMEDVADALKHDFMAEGREDCTEALGSAPLPTPPRAAAESDPMPATRPAVAPMAPTQPAQAPMPATRPVSYGPAPVTQPMPAASPGPVQWAMAGIVWLMVVGLGGAFLMMHRTPTATATPQPTETAEAPAVAAPPPAPAPVSSLPQDGHKPVMHNSVDHLPPVSRRRVRPPARPALPVSRPAVSRPSLPAPDLDHQVAYLTSANRNPNAQPQPADSPLPPPAVVIQQAPPQPQVVTQVLIHEGPPPPHFPPPPPGMGPPDGGGPGPGGVGGLSGPRPGQREPSPFNR